MARKATSLFLENFGGNEKLQTEHERFLLAKHRIPTCLSSRYGNRKQVNLF